MYDLANSISVSIQQAKECTVCAFLFLTGVFVNVKALLCSNRKCF